jgi:acetyl-CoA carboxylase carboxyltransferase component
MTASRTEVEGAAGEQPEEPGAAERAVAQRLRDFRARAESDAGSAPARDRVTRLVDSGSFAEIGTFATFDGSVASPGEHVYGGGVIGGTARIEGRPVVVAADDAHDPNAGGRATGKAARLFEMALQQRVPYVELADGSAIPPLYPGDGKTATPTARTFVAEPAFPALLDRARRIPVATALLGDAYGIPAFSAGLGDFLVQVSGTRYGLVPSDAPPVEVAAGKMAPGNGERDLLVGSEDEALVAIRRFLSYLPSYAGGPLPVTEPTGSLDDDDAITTIVPSRRSRAYDMRAVVRRLCDPGTFLELKPDFSRNLVTGIGRMGGLPVGVVANAPMHSAGALTPDSCIKAISAICLCDAFGIPLLLLHDTPGFLVSAAAERDRAVTRSMAVTQAVQLASVPKVSVVVRKAFGLAFVIMAANHDADLLLAWPGAEIGFMDPPVAANVLFEPQIRALPEDERPAFVAEKIRELSVNFEPYGVATNMAVDEIIDPATTRRRVVEHLQVVANRTGRPDGPSVLATWPRWS